MDAAIHFKPETQLQDRLLVPPARGANAAPVYPEQPPEHQQAQAQPAARDEGAR